MSKSGHSHPNKQNCVCNQDYNEQQEGIDPYLYKTHSINGNNYIFSFCLTCHSFLSFLVKIPAHKLSSFQFPL